MPKNKILKTGIEGVHSTSRGPYICTYTGGKFYPLDVRKSDIKIEDVAHALSNMCRFGGHSALFYSVAQHSVLVSRELPDGMKLQGLLHDASEAYLVDIPRPIKKLADFTEYRRIERNTQKAIYKKFKVPDRDSELLHRVDNLILATEAYYLMDDPVWARKLPKLATIISPWHPAKAEVMFLEEFERLKK